MCGECNAAENVEPSEDLNMVNIHDGTWRRVERGDTIQAGDHWEEAGGRVIETTIPGHRYTINSPLWRRIPEHERTTLQQRSEPIPPEGYRWGVIGERIVLGSQYCGPNGSILWACNSSVDDTINDANMCGGYYAIPVGAPRPAEPAPVIVFEGEDNRTDEQRTLDTMLEGLRPYGMTADGSRYETPHETLKRIFEHGYGIGEHGELFALGFTGKRKPVTYAQLRDCLNLSSNDQNWILFLERVAKRFPPKLKTAFGEGIHDVFEKYRPGSCMAGSCCRDMREIYAVNPDSIGIIYSVRSNDNPLIESTFSALFWIGKKRVYLDRMYSSGSYSHTVQYDWLCNHLETIHGKPCVPIYNRSQKRPQWEKTVTFRLKDSGNPLPYIDSLYVVKKYDGTHVWLTTEEDASEIHCRDTSGTYPDGRDRCQCCECGCRMDDDDSRSDENGNTYCESCWNDNFAYCNWNEQDYPVDEVSEQEVYSYGSRYRQRYHSGRDYNLTWSTITISDTALSDCFTELHDGRYAANGFTVEDNRGRVFATDPDSWDDATLTEDGELYHTDDVVTLSDGRVYPVDECTEVDGEWYLSGEEPEQEDDSTENSENEQPAQKEMVTE